MVVTGSKSEREYVESVVNASGTAQRVVSGAWLFSSSVIVTDPDPIRAVLTDVEAALGVTWDPLTGGAISEVHPEITVDAVADAFASYGQVGIYDPAKLAEIDFLNKELANLEGKLLNLLDSKTKTERQQGSAIKEHIATIEALKNEIKTRDIDRQKLLASMAEKSRDSQELRQKLQDPSRQLFRGLVRRDRSHFPEHVGPGEAPGAGQQCRVKGGGSHESYP